ncbi:type I secretion system permease/ATPase [Methylobacterium sp. 092160098-2]|uniref:type I secretion system permease/ATPase n=1 Tax=Methylobacterium sp. 092160098-2 TaxID=3025129 RepID=UPI002381AA60|nr:type I secretion system permease/ATPase [Methylobacterium sp. 092160098-2]MDE4909286.1 type I secretion system permease/ATPase [Methylobacterium sp. 092160098-2]
MPMTGEVRQLADLSPISKRQSPSYTDTGAAALAILAALHQRAVDVARIVHDNGRPGQPLGPDELVLAAHRNHFRAKLVRSGAGGLARLPLPAIGLDRTGLFFIIARHEPGRTLIQRPGEPPTVWDANALAREWTGQLILLSPREAGPAGEGRRFGLAWFLPAAARFKALFGEVLAASFVLQILGLVAPLFFQVVVDKVLVHKGLTTLDVLVLGLISVTVFEALLGYLRTYLFVHTTSRLDAVLGARVFRHLLALPIGYFGARPTGQTVARMRELENIRQFLTSSAMTLTVDLVFSVVFLSVMLAYSPLLTLIVALGLPVYVALSLTLSPLIRARVDEKFRCGAAQQSFLVESLAGIETLKALAIEPQARRRFDEGLAAYIAASFRVVSLAAAGSQAIQLVAKLTTAVVLWFGARAVMQGELTIGALVAFNMLASQVNQPVLRLAQLWQDFQQFRLSVARLGDILDTPTELAQASTRLDLPPLQGAIRFEGVHFRYRPDGPEILRGVDIAIRPGEVVGVVGRSGSGKSTLTRLIQRLHVPERGKVLVDGTDLALMDPAWLRRQVGVVLQENVLFARTVRENIALADPSLPMERVIAVARLAGAHDFILELPQGYDTVLEERGANLSGGQRQRIAIARALATDPRILILDEATSALDYESERAIQANMRAICQGRTVLIVAHRLSTVRGADRILVMDRGLLAEEGRHEELARRPGGLYAGLVAVAGG